MKQDFFDKMLAIAAEIDKDRVTESDFVRVFEDVIAVIKDFKDESTNDVSEIRSLAQDAIRAVETAHGQSLEDMKKSLSDFKDKVMSVIEHRVSQIQDGKPGEKGDRGEPGKEGEPGEPGKDGSPDTPLQIVQKLESLLEDDKLPIRAIRGLREELDRLKKSIGGRTSLFGGGITGKDVIKTYDLSSFLDGSTATFSLPANWTIISVHGTSFPFIFRPLVDYTFTPTSITFTSEINPTTSLAAGQTLLIVYVSP